MALVLKVAGVYLRVGQAALAEPVEQDQRIARIALRPLQQRDADGHAQLRREMGEGFDEVAVGVDRLGLPFSHGTAVDGVAVAPHLRKQRDVRAECGGLAAGANALFEVAGQAVRRRNL